MGDMQIKEIPLAKLVGHFHTDELCQSNNQGATKKLLRLCAFARVRDPDDRNQLLLTDGTGRPVSDGMLYALKLSTCSKHKR